MPRPGRAHAAQRAIERAGSLNADIIALQEVLGAGPNGAGHAEEIGAALGMGWVMASARHLRGHQFGNVVLSTASRSGSTCSTTCRGRPASRAAVSASTSPIDDKTLHLFNVHLGTAYRERRDQAERLATIVHDGRVRRRRSCWATSTSGVRGSRRRC